MTQSTRPDPEAVVHELVARCIEALESGDSAAVARICAENERWAPQVLERLAELGDRCLLRDGTRELPQQIGPYRILEQLGEGGMGLVYKAEQREPVRRQVAIKVIKLGMDSQSVLARFELERRTLAAMNHGNIAQGLRRRSH